MNRVLGEPASCFVFPFLHCMPFKELCVDRLLSAGENEYTPPFILCQQIFYFFSKIFHFFSGFFFRGFFPHFQANSLRGGRLLSVTGGRGGFPRHADAGRGARRRGAHGRRMMTRGIGAARSVPRRPCRGWRTCPQPERKGSRSTGIPAPQAVPGMGGAAWSRMAEPRKARSRWGRAILKLNLANQESSFHFVQLER